MRAKSYCAIFSVALSACVLLTMSTSCYHMPSEDDFSVIPSTNNPDFTRAIKEKSPMPSASY